MALWGPDVAALAGRMQRKLGIEQRPLPQEMHELEAHMQQLLMVPMVDGGGEEQRGRGERDSSPRSSQDEDTRDVGFIEELEDLFGEMYPDAQATGQLHACIRSACASALGAPDLALRRLAANTMRCHTPEPGDAPRRLRVRLQAPAAAVIVDQEEEGSAYKNGSRNVTSSPRSTPAAAAAAAATASAPWRCPQRSRFGHRRLAASASVGGGARAEPSSPIQRARLLRRVIVKARSKARPRLPSPSALHLEGLMTHTLAGLRVADDLD